MSTSICGTIRQVNIRNSGTTRLVTAAGVVSRNTVTHEITKVELARDGKSRGVANE